MSAPTIEGTLTVRDCDGQLIEIGIEDVHPEHVRDAKPYRTFGGT